MSSDSLLARLTTAGLRRAASDIIRLSMPSIRMDCRRAPDHMALPLGSSKLGGEPDLRPGQSWPAWRGAPMAFIAQVNLADVAAYDEERHLPVSGLLSFFCAMDGSADRVIPEPRDRASWMVSHFDGDIAALVRVPLPWELPEDLHFRACPAIFSREPTLPAAESREILALKLSDREQHAYMDLLTDEADVAFRSMAHRLLGYPLVLDRSPLITGYLEAHGIPDPLEPAVQAVFDGGRELHRKLRDLQQKAEAEWRLLLQVCSNEEAQMDWSDGVLNFCIPKEALPQRDFARVWAEMQFVYA
jgi:hypothetical protein